MPTPRTNRRASSPSPRPTVLVRLERLEEFVAEEDDELQETVCALIALAKGATRAFATLIAAEVAETLERY